MDSSIGRRDFIKQAGATAVGLPMATGVANAATGKRIKIGQIGVGHPHAEKLAVYRRSSDYEVVGIVEPDNELRAKAQSNAAFRDLPWMTQEQLLNAPGLHAVLVETRVRDLLDVAEACVAAGKHIHLDKPAGESLAQFRRLLDAAARQRLLLQMGYMFRYNPGIVLLRQFLKDGWLGEPFEVHAVMSKQVGQQKRRQWAEYAGGAMFELGCHLIDLVVGVLGAPKAVQAYPLHSSSQDDRLLDNMLAVLSYPRATATVRSSALEVEGFDRRHFLVCGTEGTVHIQPLDNPSARVALTKPRGSYRKGYQDVRFPEYERYIADAADMASILRGEKKADFSYEHDWAVQQTVLKACGLPAKP
jgi:predicted dehydrogenase